jgi:succinyl-CoA synthetase beta subunit
VLPPKDASKNLMTKDDCSTVIQQALNEKRTSLLIDEAQQVCENHHISTPKSRIASSIDDALEKARQIGYPVVLKIVSPQIIHKTESGGVMLNVKNEKELSVQYETLISGIKSGEPSATIRGVLVEKMMPPSTEVIVGGLRDKQFGPSVMFGIGGIFAETYDDVVFRIAPLDQVDALNMIHELKGSRMLEGTRGKPPLDLDAIVKVLAGVSEIMIQHDAINQLDLNPVIVYPNSACAVDSRIILTEGT